jgi:hypothetical protein
VEDLGGTHIFCDTDSLCIAAGKDGGEVGVIKLLSYDQVEQIRERFNALNPYDRMIVPDLLKWDTPDSPDDDEVYSFAISSKRYCLYQLNSDDSPRIVKRSEHGLGLYLNPESRTASGPDARNKDSWITQAWEWIVRTYALGEKTADLEWINRPAATRLTITTPELMRPFQAFNDGYSYQEQVKPHNFMLAFHPVRLVRAVYPNMRLIAPLSDPEYWSEYSVFDLHGKRGVELYITGDHESWDGNLPSASDIAGWRVPVKTYKDILREYVRHPEVKYDDAKSKACSALTTGKLSPCHLVATEYQQIGKDASSIPQDVSVSVGYSYRTYGGTDWYSAAISVLRQLDVKSADVLAHLESDGIEITRNQVTRYLSGRSTPRQETKASIIKLAGNLIYQEFGREAFGRNRWRVPDAELFTRWAKERRANLRLVTDE